MHNLQDGLPFVSIVVPNFNEEQYLDESISSLLELEYPSDRYEIIVVDNGSSDESVRKIKTYPVKLIEKPNIKVGAVRNRGFDVCQGDFIAFIDADCIAPKTWIMSAVIAMLGNDDIAAVGGGCLAPVDSPWVVTAWVSDGISDDLNASALPGASFIVRKSVFSALGGFDETIVAGEDDDLSYRIIRAGYKLCRLKSCYVTHLGYPNSLNGVLKRQIWHGTNQLQAASSIFDKMLLLTHVFMIGFVLLVLGLIGVGSSSLSLIGAVLIVFSPFVLSMNRARRMVPNKRSLTLYLQLTTIYSFFLVGRCIGLVKNYFRAIKTNFSPHG